MRYFKRCFAMILVFIMLSNTISNNGIIVAKEDENPIEANVYRPPWIKNPCMEYTILENIVLACDIAKLKYTAICLNHSLNEPHGFPININRGLDFPSTSGISKKIKKTKEYKSIIKRVKKEIKTKKFEKKFKKNKKYTMSGKKIINSDVDLYLALNKVDYTIKITNKNKSSYKLSIFIDDIYDFDYATWETYKNTPQSVIVMLVNNKAYEAQMNNHVVPYKIKINIVDSIKKK